MKIQKYKINHDGTDVFFVDRCFNSAWSQVQKYKERNKDVDGTFKVYSRDYNTFSGESWTLIDLWIGGNNG